MTEFMVVVRWIIVWLDSPGPAYVSVNWKFPTPLFVCVNCGLLSRFNPVHCEVTPSNVTLVLFVDPAPVGTRGPSADTFVPVTEYCQPVL